MEPEKFTLRRYSAIFAIIIVLVMTVLDVTVVNVALPVLATKFQVSDSATVWVITIYQLLITMLLLPLSSVGDMFSYRRIFLIGVAVFTVGSALCAWAPSFGFLVGARAVQGLGAACVMSVNIALIRLIYPAKILGRGLALNGMVIACATAAGPTIAGGILAIASWHWLFLINLPLGLLAFYIGWRRLPANPPREGKRRKYDWVSALENVVMFGLLFYALGQFSGAKDVVPTAAMVGVGLLVGVFYVRRELHRENPVFPVDLFKIRLFSLSVITSIASFIAQMIVMIALPFILLNSFGFSSITTGLLMTPWPLATMIVSPLAARFVERHNAGATAAVGMLVYGVGILLMLALPDQGVDEWSVAWRMALCGVGYGLFQTPNNIVMVSSTPLSRSGGAGGMQSTARLVGQTLGSTLVTVVFTLSAGETYGMVHTCLWIGLAFAVVAGVFSVTRKQKPMNKGM